MEENLNNWNANQRKFDEIGKTELKKSKKDEDTEKKTLYKNITIQLKGPYRKTEYSLYQPAEEEAYRPLQGVKVDPKLLEETSKKWKLKEVEYNYPANLFVLGVRAFFDFPKGGSNESQTARAKLQMIILLGQISSVLVSDFTLTVVYLGEGSKEIYDAIEALLIAVQGRGEWEGEECELKRKWLIRPVVTEKASQISKQVEDYIYGWIGPDDDGEEFWIGYTESVVAFKADVNETVQNKILKTSELMIPILFERPGRKKVKRTEVYIPSTCLSGCQKKIQNLRTKSVCLHEYIKPVIKEFHQNEKVEYNGRERGWQECWKERMVLYRPPEDQKNYEQSSAEEDLYCAALAFLEQLLKYLEFHRILTEREADDILLNYCGWILSGSPQMRVLESKWQPLPSLMDEVKLKKYDDLDLFYEFLWKYAFCSQLKCKNEKHGTAKSRGIIHTLKKERKEYFIAPRDDLLHAYQEWLRENWHQQFPSEDSEKQWEDKLYNAGLKLKRNDNGKDSWRYEYYKGEPSVCCIGIPMEEIEKAVEKYNLRNFDSRNKRSNQLQSIKKSRRDIKVDDIIK